MVFYRTAGSTKVREDESVPCHNLTGLNRHGMTEHGTGIGKGMKLAPFSARVGARRKICEQRIIELASHEGCGNLFRVHAGYACPETRRDHFACKKRCG